MHDAVTASKRGTDRVGPSLASHRRYSLATLRVPAGVADDAALLAGQAAAAVGAGPDDRELAGVGQTVLDQVVLGHRPRHAVGDGEDGVRSHARGVPVLDSAQLVDD